MSKYIIIPVKEVDNLLNKIQSACFLPHDGDMLISRAFTKEYLENPLHCKQISLDETDIEEKAREYGGNGDWELFEEDNFVIRSGAYKKALIDLKNELL